MHSRSSPACSARRRRRSASSAQPKAACTSCAASGSPTCISMSRPAAKQLGLLQPLAGSIGFELATIGVPIPGVDQQPYWERIHSDDPDWVLLAAPGPMTPAALQAAARVGFPAERIVGLRAEGADHDVLPAGAAARGYIAVALNPSGMNFPVVREIVRHVYQGPHRRAGARSAGRGQRFIQPWRHPGHPARRGDAHRAGAPRCAPAHRRGTALRAGAAVARRRAAGAARCAATAAAARGCRAPTTKAAARSSSSNGSAGAGM